MVIHLESNMVPATLKGEYTGKKFKAIVTDTVTIPMDAGLWSGGSRDTYKFVELATGKTVNLESYENTSPWNPNRKDREGKLPVGIVMIVHSIFRGKDAGLTFYVHSENAAKFLPSTEGELSAFETIVLEATASLKSSYAGRDRYENVKAYGLHPLKIEKMPTREEWEAAKASLISKGLLNKAGAITVKGRNARRSRY